MTTRLLVVSTVFAIVLLFADRSAFGFEIGGDAGRLVETAEKTWKNTTESLDNAYDQEKKNIDDEFDRVVDSIGGLAKATIKDIKKLRTTTLNDIKKLRIATKNDIKSFRDATLKDIKKARDEARDFLFTVIIIAGLVAIIAAIAFAIFIITYVRKKLPAKSPG